MRVVADNLDVVIAGRTIVSAAFLRAEPGHVVGVIGPNGSGKTTLLRAIYRAQRPAAGRILVGDADVWSMSSRASARRTAVVVQQDHVEFEFSVRETVALGRHPHHGILQPDTQEDSVIVDDAMTTAGVASLSARMVSTLSGGERQRVAIARALAQQTPVIALDEPTNHLDIRAQVELLELLTELPATVVLVLHDLNLAAAYCDELFVMAGGGIAAHGATSEVLTPELICHVYGVTAHCTTNPLTGRPSVHVGARFEAIDHPTTGRSPT